MTKIVLALIVIAAIALFAAQNTGLVMIHFLFWHSSSMPLSLVIALSAVGGALAAVIATIPIHHRRGRELARNKRELEDLREHIH